MRTSSGQQATADLVISIPDSAAQDSTLIIITYDENGGRWNCAVVSEDGHSDRPRVT